MNAMNAIHAVHDPITLAEFDVQEILHLLRDSKEFFLEFFLADEMGPNTGVPDFHLLVFNRFTDLTCRRDVAALPREHAKTTLLRLAIVYLIYFSPVQFFIYLSSAHEMAVPSIESIWNRIVSDDAVSIFGAPEIEKERLARGHIEFYITAYDANFQPYRKLVILRALGAKQSLRGMNVHNLRPEFVACDDIETEEHTKTEEGYLKLKQWFDNTLSRAISRRPGRSKLAQIGNLIATRTLLNDNINDPDWRALRLGILRKDGTPLWPAAFTLAEIKASLESAKRRGQLTSWFGELMNMPLNMENSLIAYEEIRFTPLRHPADGTAYRTFITIDPAISKRDTADAAAIVLHTIDPAGVPQITEYVHARGLGVDGITEAVRELCLKWDCRTIGCESVQLQAVLLDYFQLAFQSDGLFGYDFVPIEVGSQWKTARLKAWCAAMIEGEYSIIESDWGVANQLITFDTRKDNNDDDLIDACSMGLYMLKNYSHLIFQDRAGRTTLQQRLAAGLSQSSTTI